MLLDGGSGTLHGLARHRVDWPALTHVVVSHYHNDHVGDLSGVLFTLKYGLARAREEPLTLIGPPGFRGFLRRLGSALGDHVLDPGFPVTVVELGPDDAFEQRNSDLRIRAHPTPHTDESVAYRVETPNGVVSYTGDTGPSEPWVRLLHTGRDLTASRPTLYMFKGAVNCALRDHSHRGSTFRTPSVHSAFAMHDQGEGMRALLENGPRSRLILDNGADSTFRPRVTYPPPTTATVERMGLLMGPMEIWLI